MRTTITIDDDLAASATQYAKSRHISRGKAIVELARRGLRKSPRIKFVDGVPAFDLPKPKQPITSGHVKALEADER